MTEAVTIHSAIAKLEAALCELDELGEGAAAAHIHHAITMLEDGRAQRAPRSASAAKAAQ